MFLISQSVIQDLSSLSPSPPQLGRVAQLCVPCLYLAVANEFSHHIKGSPLQLDPLSAELVGRKHQHVE